MRFFWRLYSNQTPLRKRNVLRRRIIMQLNTAGPLCDKRPCLNAAMSQCRNAAMPQSRHCRWPCPACLRSYYHRSIFVNEPKLTDDGSASVRPLDIIRARRRAARPGPSFSLRQGRRLATSAVAKPRRWRLAPSASCRARWRAVAWHGRHSRRWLRLWRSGSHHIAVVVVEVGRVLLLLLRVAV
jgi:hypothetical protein